MKKKLVALVLSAILVSGCASIVSESSYPVAINSSPSDAHFVITDKKGDEIHSGRTPYTLTLNSGGGYFKSASYTVTFKKEGFDDQSFVIESKMDGWYWGNILFGGLIGMLIVDPVSGAMWKLPEAKTFYLDDKVASSKPESQAELKIISIEDVPSSDLINLVRIN